MNKKRIADAMAPLLDLALVVFVIPAAFLLRVVRRIGMARLRLSRAVFVRIGVLPIRDHYYEPFVSPKRLRRALDEERKLPGIDFRVPEQLGFLSGLVYENELTNLASPSSNPGEFRLGNQSFESGDAEFLYQVIRKTKPARVYEIGSGHSTLVARSAINKNCEEDAAYTCRHLCIEPYEAPWLEGLGVEVLRRRVEDVDNAIFVELNRNDLLFIDSSHVIRPQGDVVTEYLEILPILRPGVIVHVHDIFSPRDYPKEWIVDSMLLWNEQYLLEAFLTNNDRWSIIAALNLLKHRHFDVIKRVCPYLTNDREPGSFYMQRN
jgi:predicted O-methyltransferase YrrM